MTKTIELDRNEELTLLLILAYVGGRPDNSLRKFADSIITKLGIEAEDHGVFGVAYMNLREGKISFKDDTVTYWEDNPNGGDFE